MTDVNEYAERWLRGHGWDESFDADAVLEELTRAQRQRRLDGTLQRERVLRFWLRLRERRYPPDAIQ